MHTAYDAYDEDLFADSRMPFGDHIEVLRRHLWRAVAGLGLILTMVFVLDFTGYATETSIGIGKPALEMIAAPVEDQLKQFHDRRVARLAQKLAAQQQEPKVEQVPIDVEIHDLANELVQILNADFRVPTEKEPEAHYVRLRGRVPTVAWGMALNDTQRQLSGQNTLRTFNLSEGMMVYFKVALVCGVVLGSPWLYWQLWSFVAAGLYPHERRTVNLFLPFSLGLFLTGVLVCQFLVMPKAVEALLWFNEWLGFEPDLRLSEWLSFATIMPLVFGGSFQTPLIMLMTNRIGMFDVQTFRRNRRLAWFGLAIVSAVLTPSTDAISLLYLWIPLGLLYELGIWLCALRPLRQEGEHNRADIHHLLAGNLEGTKGEDTSASI